MVENYSQTLFDLSKYIETKLQIIYFYLKESFFEKQKEIWK